MGSLLRTNLVVFRRVFQFEYVHFSWRVGFPPNFSTLTIFLFFLFFFLIFFASLENLGFLSKCSFNYNWSILFSEGLTSKYKQFFRGCWWLKPLTTSSEVSYAVVNGAVRSWGWYPSSQPKLGSQLELRIEWVPTM